LARHPVVVTFCQPSALAVYLRISVQDIHAD
jgi:hypothetical protein